MLSRNIFRRMQICDKKEKDNKYNYEQLELSESDDEFDKSHEYQHIYDGLR